MYLNCYNIIILHILIPKKHYDKASTMRQLFDSAPILKIPVSNALERFPFSRKSYEHACTYLFLLPPLFSYQEKLCR